MRQRFDYSEHDDAMFRGPIRYQPAVITLTADNYQITTAHPAYLLIDPQAARDVRLPAEETSAFFEYTIFNIGDTAGETITVKNDDETETLAVLAPGQSMSFLNPAGTAGTGWMSSDLGGGEAQPFAAVATADGLTTGLIPLGASYVAITSAAAANIVTLPVPVAGRVVHGSIAATGCEIRSVTGVTINAVAFPNELALAANSYFKALGASATEWLIKTCTKAGVVSATDIPDA
jgi:hypothetical protein